MDKSAKVASSKSAPGAFSQERDTPARTVLRRWLREPLVHFLLIGLLLFVAYGVRSHSTSQLGGNRIELTLDDVRQLQMGFAAQWQRQPTPDELTGLVENRVREEILYREALTMGLDKDDTIVKRRMAQKMEFLSEDVTNAH
jgi:peptidyl-prolyl cis-trans isomerase C